MDRLSALARDDDVNPQGRKTRQVNSFQISPNNMATLIAALMQGQGEFLSALVNVFINRLIPILQEVANSRDPMSALSGISGAAGSSIG